MPVHATTQQILSAYAGLSEDELLGLRCYAMQQLRGTGFSEPLDLMHETLSRSLEGVRNWPLHVDFTLYFAQTMRSIVSGIRNRLENSMRHHMSIEDMTETAPHLAPRHPSVEDEVIAMQEYNLALKTADAARVALEGDHDAQRVLDGMLSGMSAREMCLGFGLDAKAFDAARHRVMRRVRPTKRMR